MNPSKISALETEVSELKKLVQNLLNKVKKLTSDNSSLREELRHLKKLKGQPKIHSVGKKEFRTQQQKDNSENPTSASGNTPPPKGKRQRSEKPGRTIPAV